MTRIPRKLKKGFRTLHGNPRTKWQRKSLLHLKKTMEALHKAFRAEYYYSDVMNRLYESINPVKIPDGGIVMMPPDPPKIGVAVMPTNEIVLNRQQLKMLAHPLIITPSDCVPANISSEHLSVATIHFKQKYDDQETV